MKVLTFESQGSGSYPRLFNFYLWLSRRKFNGDRDSYNNVVCDSLGPIDTLGSQGAVKRFTFSHSDEGCFIWGFIIPRILKIEFYVL